MKLIYLVTEDSYFYSHRLPMARAAQAAGFDVAVITNAQKHKEAIEYEKIRVIPLSLERRNLNPFLAARHIAQVTAIYRREKPDAVHHVAMKPVLYGSIAAWAAGVPRVVNAFAGLGYVFTADTPLAKSLRLMLWPAFWLFLKQQGSHLLLQNDDDLHMLDRMKLVPPGRTHVIRGSGVEMLPAVPYPSTNGDFVCIFAARMIGIKGLQTLKEAFALLQQRAPRIKLWLCGRPDPANPGSWTEEQLQLWTAYAPNVVYKGHCTDMRAMWAQAHVALQPSYGGEGVPKSLLEAAAMARPIIAADVPGCRDMVEPGRNGFIVPPRDAAALANAIEKLSNSGNGAAMGAESRKIVEEKRMTAADITAQTRALYSTLLK
jgi:glycosyltransferase involved in cell wall biosynthesis